MPSGAAPVDLLDFRRGYIRPAIAIEIGLDYGIEHLKGDVAKLLNSRPQYGYILHLARPTGESQDDVEDYIMELIENEKKGGPRIAYANITSNEVRYRKLGESIAIRRLSAQD